MSRKSINQDKKKKAVAGKNRKNYIVFSIITLSVIVLGLFVAKNLSKKKHIDKYGTERTSSNELQASARFVGGKVCGECHEEEYKLWSGSHHDLAMQEANDKTVLGDFKEKEFNHFGVKTRFYKRNGKFMVRTDGPDGRLHDYEIKYTFGVYPLQQHLIEFPGGRLQALSIAWDTRPLSEGGQRWFHLYSNEKITHDDTLHWTGSDQNWNYMCAGCHSTNLQKNYDLKSDAYSTTWSEINVSCEACHGPGSRHVEWAKRSESENKKLDYSKGLAVSFNERKGVKWTTDPQTGRPKRSEPRITDIEIETCAPCHSRRSVIWKDYAFGKPYMDTYLPQLLEEDMYFADGQIHGEVYEYGSFLQSKMYHEGVTCSDCHEPHSLKLRASGNGVCTQCHLSSKYDSESHHFHKVSSSGASCVECHMPTTKYMVIDARHDHSIRIPSPDLSLKIGSPNACNKCHIDRTSEWADENINKWYVKRYKGYQTYSEAFYSGRTGAPLAEELLVKIAMDTNSPNIARATALKELNRYLSPLSIESVRLGLGSDDPMIRAGALDALEAVESGVRLQLAFNLLNDPVRAVRVKAITTLASAPKDQLTVEQRTAFEKAIDEYVRAQLTNADRPEAHLNIGLLYAQIGRIDEAESEYQTAIKLQPSFVPAYVNLADLYRIKGRDDEGERTLGEALKLSPQNAEVYHALGLLLVRKKQMPEAIDALEKSAKLKPDDPHYSYVYAVALNTIGKPVEAMEVLKEAHARNPNDREVLYALVYFNRDKGNISAARQYAEKLIKLSPSDPAVRRLLDELKEGAKR
jgi:Flp pilus assembly protein TadD